MSLFDKLIKKHKISCEPENNKFIEPALPSEKISAKLTTREADVFRLLVEGYTLKECAQKLEIKYSTINTHMTSIYKKLNVKSRAELIIRYRDYQKTD